MWQFVQLMTNPQMDNSKSKQYLEQIAFDMQEMTTVLVHQEFHGVFREFFPSRAQTEYYINRLMQFLTLEGVTLQNKQKAASVVGLFTKINPEKLETRYLASVYFKMLTNWRIPIAVKQVMKRGFTLFIRDRWEELSGMFEFIAAKLTNLIEAAESIGFGQREKSFQSEQIQHGLIDQTAFLTISFPEDIEPAYDSLFLMVDSLIEANLLTEGFEASQSTILKILRLLLTNVMNPERLFTLSRVQKLFNIWEQFALEVVKQRSREAKVREEVAKWEELGSIFCQFYRFNAVKINESFNLLLTTAAEETEHRKLLQTKEEATKAHYAILLLLQGHQNNQDEWRLLIFRQLATLADDLLLSLDYLASNYETMPIHQTNLGKNLLSLLTILIKMNQVSSEWMIGVTKRVLLPIFYKEIQLTWENYASDPSEIYFFLEDCCCSQSSEIMLSELCRCFEEMVQKDGQAIINFAFEHLSYSLRRKLIPDLQEGEVFGYFPTASLMLSVISYKPNGFQQYLPILKEILASGLFNGLEQIEKAFFYILYQSFWHRMYPPLDSIGEQFLILCTQPQFVSLLSFFGLHFLFEVVNNSLYSERFISSFLLGFSRLGEFEIKWQVLNKVIRSFIEKMSPSILIQLMEQLHYRTLLEINEIFKENNIHVKGYSIQMAHTLDVCRQIAVEHEFCKQNEGVRTQLMRIVKSLLPHSSPLNLDDDIVRLTCEIIDISQTISMDEISLIEIIASVYRENEYRGNNYFQLLSRYIQFSEDEAVAAKIFQIVIEAFSYYSYYPEDQWEEDGLVNYSGNVHLLQNLLLKSGNLLSGEHKIMSMITDQFKKTRTNILSIFTGCTIVAKLHILTLLASYFLGLPVETKYLAADVDLFKGYDASLLVYVVSKLQSSMPQSVQIQLLHILIVVVQTSNNFNPTSINNPLHRSKIDEPLNFIDPVVILQPTIQEEFLEYLKINRVESFINYLPEQARIQLIQLAQSKPEVFPRQVNRPILKVVKKKDQPDARMLVQYSERVSKRSRQDVSDEEDEGEFRVRGKHKNTNRQKK